MEACSLPPLRGTEAGGGMRPLPLTKARFRCDTWLHVCDDGMVELSYIRKRRLKLLIPGVRADSP